MATKAEEPLDIEVRPVTPERWADVERFFEAKGGPSYCWCMAWRADDDEKQATSHAARKAMLKLRVVDREEPVGLLAYLDGDPVAWCSVAPRSTYRGLGGAEHGRTDPSRIWSIVCFHVLAPVRRRGVSTLLLREAVDQARRHGATVIEAYPVDADSPSYRYMGFTPMFEAAGFRPVGDIGSRRHLMVKRVRPKRS